MNGRERILAHLAGRPVDRLPLMPITMQFACDRIGAKYRDYETDDRLLVEGQMHVAEQFDSDYVNTMSDPACEAADCGAVVEFFENSPAAILEEEELLADKTKLTKLKTPDPLGGGRMHNGVTAVALFKEKRRGGFAGGSPDLPGVCLAVREEARGRLARSRHGRTPAHLRQHTPRSRRHGLPRL